MKFKSIAIALLAAMTLVACSKDTDNGRKTTDPDEGIFIQFSGLSDDSPAARSTTPSVGDQTPVSFQDGYLVFGDEVSDKITHVVAITTNTSSLPTVTVSALEQGLIFNGIEASHVYVIANVNGLTPPAVGNVLTTLLQRTVNVLDQSDASYMLSTATLYGVGEIKNAGTTDPANQKAVTAGADKEAIFSVKPLAARLELSKLSGDADHIQYPIVSYKLAGIFINNFYLEVGLNGSLLDATDYITSGGNHVNMGNIPGRYASVTNSGLFLDAWEEYLFNEGLSAASTLETIGSANVAQLLSPTGLVWAYNVLAPYGSSNSPTATPHIVLHFEDMILGYDNTGSATPGSDPNTWLYDNEATGNDGECFLTITRYIQGSADLPIEASKIYKITDVPFNGDDLGDIPEIEEPEGFKVWVEVEFVKWTEENVIGGW